MAAKTAQPADDGRAAALAALEAAETAYGERLQRIWDGAHAVAERKGARAYQADELLRAHGVPLPDPHAHDDFHAEWYSTAGLQHLAEDRAAGHERELAGVSQAVRAARQQGNITLAEGNEFLTANGFDAEVPSTRVTLGGQVTFTYAGMVSQNEIGNVLTEALRHIEGVSDVNVGGARVTTREA